MVVAVVAVRMVQVPVYQVINMIAVGNGLVPAARTVPVARFVTAAGVVRRTAVRVFIADLQHMFVNVVAVGVVKVSVVKIINMIAVANRGVAAVFAVNVVVIVVMLKVTGSHIFCPRVVNNRK